MACQSWQGQLDAWVDAELPSASARELQTHLRGCRECSARALDTVQLKRAVGHAAANYVPSAEFRARMQRQFGAARPRRLPWFQAGLVVAAVLIAVVAVGVVWTPRHESARTWQEIADMHVANLASATPVDVVSTDRHTVKPWFQGKLPFTFNLPELAGTEFTLVGGRMAFLDGSPAAHLLFSVRKHYISVFITQERQGASGGPRSFNGASWSQGGLEYFVITDASRADVVKLEGLLKTAH